MGFELTRSRISTHNSASSGSKSMTNVGLSFFDKGLPLSERIPPHPLHYQLSSTAR